MRRLQFLSIIIVILALSALLFYVSLPHASKAGVALSEHDVFSAPSNSVTFIYPDNQAKPKPHGASTPTPEAYGGYLTAMSTFLGLARNPQLQISDQSQKISGSGNPQDVGKVLFLIGGPQVNSVSSFLNASALGLSMRIADGRYWLVNDGEVLDGSQISSTELGTSDVFVIERLQDLSGRIIFAAYGYGWQGTLAGIFYFKFKIYPKIWAYTDNVYVLRWSSTGTRPPGADDSFRMLLGTVQSSSLETTIISVATVVAIAAIALYAWSRRKRGKDLS